MPVVAAEEADCALAPVAPVDLMPTGKMKSNQALPSLAKVVLQVNGGP